ncbi:GlxA family transcriptional regulator [Marinobacter sp. HL-58]|uniref:GlxA family transcriptional regulator n=1 Tax=Marinobacter sp. HL-58 TaxID=1479237 RepID=UPI000483B9A1|nr:helix-turn-helix domain-containing protein [Marinobacter sp. HL-58]KPP98033.1 MAG: transcriptional regulator, AraC family with amidase-like domain [Marinobacter sp. HL-58]
MPAPTHRKPTEVAILATSQTTSSTVYGMNDLLCSAGRDWAVITGGEAGPPLVNPTIISASGTPQEVANGGWVKPHRRFSDNYRPDVVCILEIAMAPDSQFVKELTTEIHWLKAYWESGGTVASACTGSLLMAEAGLLDGEDATTHWAFCDFAARRYPRVRFHSNRALVTSGKGQRLIMAGGGASWMDLGLYLIARFCGIEEAIRVAKVHLIDWHEAGQQPYAVLSCSRQSEDAVIARCQVWVAENYDRPSPVNQMIARSGLSERSFKRRFQLATGMTPMEYVLTLRLEEAKQLLETSDLSIDAVAEAVGYQDAGFFGRKFLSRVGMTPTQYRRRFHGLRQHVMA